MSAFAVHAVLFTLFAVVQPRPRTDPPLEVLVEWRRIAPFMEPVTAPNPGSRVDPAAREPGGRSGSPPPVVAEMPSPDAVGEPVAVQAATLESPVTAAVAGFPSTRHAATVRAPVLKPVQMSQPKPSADPHLVGSVQGTSPSADDATPTGSAVPVAPLDLMAVYQRSLGSHLDRYRHYPMISRQRHEEGVVTVRFTIDLDGRIAEATLEQSSGFAYLDREAIEMLHRAEPLPAAPVALRGGRRLELIYPLRFRLDR